MSTRLLFSNHNPETHISTVTIATDIGEFTASVTCREEDYENESRYFGCTLAEMKALMKYTTAKRFAAENQFKSLERYYNTMVGTRTFSMYTFWFKKLEQELHKTADEIRKWKDYRNSLKYAYYMQISTRDRFLNTPSIKELLK